MAEWCDDYVHCQDMILWHFYESQLIFPIDIFHFCIEILRERPEIKFWRPIEECCFLLLGWYCHGEVTKGVPVKYGSEYNIIDRLHLKYMYVHTRKYSNTKTRVWYTRFTAVAMLYFSSILTHEQHEYKLGWLVFCLENRLLTLYSN